MRKINITDLIKEEKETGKKHKFHFTESEKTLEKIKKEGMVAQIGTNAKGIDKENKVFYSEGIESLMQTIDVWVRFELERKHLERSNKKFNDTFHMDPYEETQIEYTIGELAKLKEFENVKEDIQKVKDRLKEEYDAYATKTFPDTEEKFLEAMYNKENVEATLEKAYDDFKRRKYLLLDYTPKFSYIDEPKLQFKNHGKDFKKNWMFGKYSDFDGMVSDKWNMYTTEDIAADNISQIVSDNGDRAIDIIQEVYDNSEKNYDYSDLKLLIDYAKEKEKEGKEQESKKEEEQNKNENNSINEYAKKTTLDKIMDIQIREEKVWPDDAKNIVREKLENNGKLLEKAMTLADIQSRIEMFEYQIGREENEEEKDKLEKKLEEVQKEYDDKNNESTELVRESNFARFRKNIKEKIKSGIEKVRNKFVDLNIVSKKEKDENNDNDKEGKEKVNAELKEQEEIERIEDEKEVVYDEITKRNIENIDRYVYEKEKSIEETEEIEKENENINYLSYDNDERKF